jgi:DNA-binding MarR family transcriptional regulator
MINELKLNSNHLLIYAIIHSFSQTENQYYTGGIQYLMDWTNLSKKTVIDILKSLVERKLIIREEFDFNKVRYRTIHSWNSGVEITPSVVTKLHQDGVEITPNNTNINNINNIEKKINKEKKYTKYGGYGRVLLTTEEYDRLCKDFDKEYIDKQITLLDEYIESNNNKNKYCNFNLVLRKSIREKWFDRQFNKPIQKQTNEPDWLNSYVENFENGVEDL